MRRLFDAWLVAALAVAVVCCRGEEVTIQSAEPEIIAKTDLEGEWYYMVTTVDVMGTTALTFPGETGRDMSVMLAGERIDLLAAGVGRAFLWGKGSYRVGELEPQEWPEPFDLVVY